MIEDLNHGGRQDALGIGEAQYAQAVIVNQRINEQTGAEEVLLSIHTGLLGRYDTALGVVNILSVESVTDPRSRAQLRLKIGSEGWLQKSSHTTVRHRGRPRSIDLIDREGRQQLPSSRGQERWLVVNYRNQEEKEIATEEYATAWEDYWSLPLDPGKSEREHPRIMYGRSRSIPTYMDDWYDRSDYKGMDESGIRVCQLWTTEEEEMGKPKHPSRPATLEESLRLVEAMAATIQRSGMNDSSIKSVMVLGVEMKRTPRARVHNKELIAIAEVAVDVVKERLNTEPEITPQIVLRLENAQRRIVAPLSQEKSD